MLLPPLPRALAFALLCSSTATTALAFVVPSPPAAAGSPRQAQGGGGGGGGAGSTVVMMAQRHYTKFTRGDFLLKSALAVRVCLVCRLVDRVPAHRPDVSIHSSIHRLAHPPTPHAPIHDDMTDGRLRPHCQGPAQGGRGGGERGAAPRGRRLAPPAAVSGMVCYARASTDDNRLTPPSSCLVQGRARRRRRRRAGAGGQRGRIVARSALSLPEGARGRHAGDARGGGLVGGLDEALLRG